MDKITKAHYRFVRQTLESKDKDTQASIRRILKHRAVYIKKYKALKEISEGLGTHHISVIYTLSWVLSELGIDIKRYGG